MKIKYIIILLLSAIFGFYACESMDDNYKQYLGENNYSGKIDNLRVYPGYERVILAWDNPRDQKSKSVRIIYGSDSVHVNYEQLVDSVSIDGLVSGTGYEFIIYTIDGSGNLSIPTSVTAFPISANFVESLTAPSLVVDVQNNEQALSIIGLSNVMMRFSGKINYTIQGPDGFSTEGLIDITDQVVTTNPNTGAVEYNTINELSIPVADLGGVPFFPPGAYTFTYNASVWPIMGNLVSIDEIELSRESNIDVQPIIVNVTSLGGVISDQYNTGGGEGIEKLIDGNSETKYLTSRGSTTWMMFKTNNPAIVSRYSLTSANDAQSRDPQDWVLEASNDGENWVTIDERKGIVFPIRYQTQTFEVSGNNEQYQYYRLDVRKNAGASIFQLAEWTLYGPKLL